MLTNYLGSWQFWLIMAIAVLAVLWIWKNVFHPARYEPHIGFSKYHCLVDEQDEPHHKPVTHRNYRMPSPRDTVPSTDIASKEKTVYNPDVDLTPSIPSHITDKPSFNGRESKGEAKCREVMEKIYGVSFPRVRPDWLINPATGRKMELDGFNETLMLAFEYNGEQHYKSNHRFNKSYDDFIEQVKRDNLKVELCDRKGVYLITVPYNVNLDDIESYIRYYLPDAVMAREIRASQISKIP